MAESSDPIASFFRLKQPCGNCPFRKSNSIRLRPGRLEGIVEGLLSNDMQTFACHKTLKPRPEGEAGYDDEDAEDADAPRSIREGELMCAGAAAWLLKKGRPTVGMRFAVVLGSIAEDHWKEAESMVLDPDDLTINECLQTRSGLTAPTARLKAVADATGGIYETRQIRDRLRKEPHCAERRSARTARSNQQDREQN